jgi:hypothetical protein
MTPEERIGRIGQNVVERWAAQANITANPSIHDEKGWDLLLQVPPVPGMAGEMVYQPHSVGSAKLEVCVADAVAGRVDCEAYRAQAVFPFLPDEFDKTRLVSKYMSCVIERALKDGREGLSASFAFRLPRDERITLNEISGPIRIAHAMAYQNERPINLRVTIGSASIDLPHDAAHGFEVTDRGSLDLLSDLVTLCDAFDVPGDTELALEMVEQQREHVRFLAHVLRFESGPLRGPHRDAVPVGAMFGATTETGLQLIDRTLGAFVGVYGLVTECQEIAGIGALVTVENASAIVEKVVVTGADADAPLDVARAKLLEQLRTLGCQAISNQHDPRTLRRDRDGDNGPPE